MAFAVAAASILATVIVAVAAVTDTHSSGATVSCNFSEEGSRGTKLSPQSISDVASQLEAPTLLTTNVDDPTADDFSESIASFFALRTWAVFHLADDPDALAEVASPLLVPDGPVFQGMRAGLARQEAEAFRIVSAPSRIAEIKFGFPRPSEERALLCVQEVRPGGTVWIDMQTDSIMREFDPSPLSINLIYELRRNEVEQWQLWAITEPHD